MKGSAMNDPKKAGALILNNLGMFNEAALLFTDEIEVKIFEKIKEEIEKWCQENDWEGKGDWYGDPMLVSQPTWKLDNDTRYKASFIFSYEKDDHVDTYSLASFCGCGKGHVGFWFTPDFGYFGKKQQWINFCNKSLQAVITRLQKLGFKYDKGYWFLPVTLSSTNLAVAYEGDDYTEALQPLIDSLDQLKEAQPIFDEIISAAELAFNIKDAEPL